MWRAFLIHSHCIRQYMLMNLNDTFRRLCCGLPDDIARLKAAGYLEEAIRLIDLRLQEKKLPGSMLEALTAQREMLRRIPEDFPLTRAEALAECRQHIPSFTEAEFDALTAEGKIGWLFLNGEKRYFDRFFSSVCKTDPAFAARAGVTLPGVESATAASQANSVLNAAMRTIKTRGSDSHTICIRSSVRLKDALFTPGAHIRAWLPVPADCASQSEIKISCADPAASVAPADAPQRTVCFDAVLQQNRTFAVEYTYRSTAVFHDTAGMTAPDAAQPDFCTGEIAPHVMFTPYIRTLAAELSAGKKGPVEKARAFYDYITTHMFYSFMPAYFTLESIAETGARNRTGDCGVLALLFMTLCRCAGIPAEWQSGLVAEPDFIGAHDWIRFYAAPYGWLYADPSFGVGAVRAGNEERRQFYFGNIDPFRMVANNAFQTDFTVPMTGFRADPYDNQVGEMELDGRGLTYGEFERTKEIISFD